MVLFGSWFKSRQDESVKELDFSIILKTFSPQNELDIYEFMDIKEFQQEDILHVKGFGQFFSSRMIYLIQ